MKAATFFNKRITGFTGHTEVANNKMQHTHRITSTDPLVETTDTLFESVVQIWDLRMGSGGGKMFQLQRKGMVISRKIAFKG